jgi:hypothetical protein
MYTFEVYKIKNDAADISPLSIKRDWMDETFDAHAYKCFPVSLTNGMGWGISFPEDITFIWDGISDSMADHVKILEGEKWAYAGRANATISFNTGLMFRTKENLSMLHYPVPNYPRDGVSPFTTSISTSFFRGEFPAAWRITRPNVEITVKAGTPVIAVMPISLSELNGSEAIMKSMSDLPRDFFPDADYGNIVYEINKAGKWTNFYRDAVDHKGQSLGKHEVKALRLKVIDGPQPCGIE